MKPAITNGKSAFAKKETAWRDLKMSFGAFTILLLTLVPISQVQAQPNKPYLCNVVTVISDNENSPVKWKPIPPITGPTRVFSLDASCARAGKNLWVTGGGYAFNNPQNSHKQMEKWSVVGSLPIDQTNFQPANAWRCIAFSSDPDPGKDRPYQLACFAVCCKLPTGN